MPNLFSAGHLLSSVSLLGCWLKILTTLRLASLSLDKPSRAGNLPTVATAPPPLSPLSSARWAGVPGLAATDAEAAVPVAVADAAVLVAVATVGFEDVPRLTSACDRRRGAVGCPGSLPASLPSSPVSPAEPTSGAPPHVSGSCRSAGEGLVQVPER